MSGETEKPKIPVIMVVTTSKQNIEVRYIFWDTQYYSQISQKGKVINNPRDMAQAFDHHFTNTAAKVDEEIPRLKKISS